MITDKYFKQSLLSAGTDGRVHKTSFNYEIFTRTRTRPTHGDFKEIKRIDREAAARSIIRELREYLQGEEGCGSYCLKRW